MKNLFLCVCLFGIFLKVSLYAETTVKTDTTFKLYAETTVKTDTTFKLYADTTVKTDTTFKEEQGEELCLFAHDVFNSLANTERKREIRFYEDSRDPIIQNLAEKFASAFQEGASSEKKGAAVSELGRLIKCAADDGYQLPYTLNRRELEEKTILMERVLRNALPKDPNYHKLMIESLADERWDIALYSYCKIAEHRCVR